MRRLLLVLALAGLALAALVLPAAAQVAPTLTIDTFRTLRPGGCANVGDNFDLVVGGATNQGSVGVVLFSPGGTAIDKASADPSSNRWQTSVVWNYRETGTYRVEASAGSARPVSGFLEVPCQTPTLEYAPTCFAAGVRTQVRMTGRHFAPFGTGYMYYDVGGSEAQSRIRIPVSGRGVFFADFTVTPSDRAHPGEATDANREVVARATWRPCPPATTTTTRPTVADTTTTTEPDDDTPSTTAATTTTRPSDTPPVTVPPSVDFPPQTAGATLTVTPALGPAGFVTGAAGTGFPPGAVELHWQPGIGRTLAIVGPDGSFTVRVLVFPNDRLGPRALIASAAGGAGGAPVSTFAAFLVVPSTVEPSGQNVNQINRIRRFNQR